MQYLQHASAHPRRDRHGAPWARPFRPRIAAREPALPPA